MLISERTSLALDEIVGAFFDLNRSFDRAVSIMQNKFSMPNAANIIHHKLAHLFPLLADVVSEFKDEYNMTTIYPETHRDERDYNDLAQMMGTLLKEMEEVYQMITMTYDMAAESRELNVAAMLMRLTRMFTVVMGQVITLSDKAKELPTAYDQYDAHIERWGINGIEINGEF